MQKTTFPLRYIPMIQECKGFFGMWPPETNKIKGFLKRWPCETKTCHFLCEYPLGTRERICREQRWLWWWWCVVYPRPPLSWSLFLGVSHSKSTLSGLAQPHIFPKQELTLSLTYDVPSPRKICAPYAIASWHAEIKVSLGICLPDTRM